MKNDYLETEVLETIANFIVDRMDSARITSSGGYPSCTRTFDNGGEDYIAIASIDHDGRPALTVESLTDFISDNVCFFE